MATKKKRKTRAAKSKKRKKGKKRKVVKRAAKGKKKARKVKRKVKKAKKVRKGTKATKAGSKKKAVKGATKKAPPPIGKIIHYYDRIGVGIIDLKAPLSLGESLVIRRGDEEFEQQVTSMQIEHQPITHAKKGDVIGLKLTREAHEGALVLRR